MFWSRSKKIQQQSDQVESELKAKAVRMRAAEDKTNATLDVLTALLEKKTRGESRADG